MSYDLSNLLVIGISSRALFNLEHEDRIYRTEGLQAFSDYQRARENEVLEPGAAFPLIKGLLGLNPRLNGRKVEVILMSRNQPDVCLRVFNSIDFHELDISRAALTGGARLGPYLEAFNVGLFLSTTADDVQWAANQGFPAGLIYSPPLNSNTTLPPIRIAFDGDCVIFSDEAQKVYDKQGEEAFFEYEQANADRALPAGPFAKLLRTLATIQGPNPDTSPVRIALVTDRNKPAHKRALLTLRAWNVRIDEAFFLGGIPKANILRAFGAHMFFDDREEYCQLAAEQVPTGRVLLPITETVAVPPEQVEVTIKAITVSATSTPKPQDRFLLICKTYLRREQREASTELEQWYQINLHGLEDIARSQFLDELEQSIVNTPKGSERRAVGEKDSRKLKLMSFLENLASKTRSK